MEAMSSTTGNGGRRGMFGFFGRNSNTNSSNNAAELKAKQLEEERRKQEEFIKKQLEELQMGDELEKEKKRQEELVQEALQKKQQEEEERKRKEEEEKRIREEEHKKWLIEEEKRQKELIDKYMKPSGESSSAVSPSDKDECTDTKEVPTKSLQESTEGNQSISNDELAIDDSFNDSQGGLLGSSSKSRIRRRRPRKPNIISDAEKTAPSRERRPRRRPQGQDATKAESQGKTNASAPRLQDAESIILREKRDCGQKEENLGIPEAQRTSILPDDDTGSAGPSSQKSNSKGVSLAAHLKIGEKEKEEEEGGPKVNRHGDEISLGLSVTSETKKSKDSDEDASIDIDSPEKDLPTAEHPWPVLPKGKSKLTKVDCINSNVGGDDGFIRKDAPDFFSASNANLLGNNSAFNFNFNEKPEEVNDDDLDSVPGNLGLSGIAEECDEDETDSKSHKSKKQDITEIMKRVVQAKKNGMSATNGNEDTDEGDDQKPKSKPMNSSPQEGSDTDIDSESEVDAVLETIKDVDKADIFSKIKMKLNAKLQSAESKFEDAWTKAEVDKSFVDELKRLKKSDNTAKKQEKEPEETIERLHIYEDEKRKGKKKKKRSKKDKRNKKGKHKFSKEFKKAMEAVFTSSESESEEYHATSFTDGDIRDWADDIDRSRSPSPARSRMSQSTASVSTIGKDEQELEPDFFEKLKSKSLPNHSNHSRSTISSNSTGRRSTASNLSKRYPRKEKQNTHQFVLDDNSSISSKSSRMPMSSRILRAAARRRGSNASEKSNSRNIKNIISNNNNNNNVFTPSGASSVRSSRRRPNSSRTAASGTRSLNSAKTWSHKMKLDPSEFFAQEVARVENKTYTVGNIREEMTKLRKQREQASFLGSPMPPMTSASSSSSLRKSPHSATRKTPSTTRFVPRPPARVDMAAQVVTSATAVAPRKSRQRLPTSFFDAPDTVQTSFSMRADFFSGGSTTNNYAADAASMNATEIDTDPLEQLGDTLLSDSQERMNFDSML